MPDSHKTAEFNEELKEIFTKISNEERLDIVAEKLEDIFVKEEKKE